MPAGERGLCHQPAPWRAAQRLQTGSTGRHRPAPAHPQDPQPRLGSWGLLQGRWPHGPFLPEEPPEGRPGQASDALAWSGSAATSLSWAWVPTAPVARSSSTAICLGCHGAPHAQEQGPGSPRGRQSNSKARETHTASLHGGCSCPHPPAPGKPARKEPLFPGPRRWRVASEIKQKSLGPPLFSPTIILWPGCGRSCWSCGSHPSDPPRLRAASPALGWVSDGPLRLPNLLWSLPHLRPYF